MVFLGGPGRAACLWGVRLAFHITAPGFANPERRRSGCAFAFATAVTKRRVGRREPQATEAANPVLGVCDVLRSPTSKTSGDDKTFSDASAQNLTASTLPLIRQAQCSNGWGRVSQKPITTGPIPLEKPVGDGQISNAPCSPRHTASLGWENGSSGILRPEHGQGAPSPIRRGGQHSPKRQVPPLLQDGISTLPMPLHLALEEQGYLGGKWHPVFCLFLPLWCKNKRAKRHCA